MKSFCIIGLGRFGQTLALTLAKSHHQVMIIDENPEVVNLLADSVTNAVIGDATNEAVLRASGVKSYDCAVVCISKDINDSLMAALLLKDLGVPQVVVRAISDLHRRVLLKIGVDQVVFPEQDMGEKLAYTLDKVNVLEYIEFSNEYSIVELRVPDEWVGRNIVEVDVRKKYKITIIAVCDADTGIPDISPDLTRPFKKGDAVTVVGANENINKFVK